MATEFLRDDEGQVIYVQGYAAIFNSLSVPLDDHDGQRELIRPGAFDYILRNLRASTTCTLHHLGAGGTIGSIFDRTLQLWSDDFGLAFECGPLAVNRKNVWAVRSIMTGAARGCSWRGIPAEVAIEKIDGESVRVISKFQHLSHISPLVGGFYPATATWCSHEHLDGLPDRLKRLSLHWQEYCPVPRAQTTLAAKSKPELAAAVHHKAKARHLLRRRAS